MKTSFRTLITTPAAGLALVLVLAACRDSATMLQSAGESAPRSITPHTTVVTSGVSAVITLALDLRGDVGKIGSFTGRLRFDPTALVFVGDESPADGTLRASNPGAGEIRVAGASATGVAPGSLMSLRFTVKNAAALGTVEFELDEVHELTRVDGMASLRRSPPPRPVR